MMDLTSIARRMERIRQARIANGDIPLGEQVARAVKPEWSDFGNWNDYPVFGPGCKQEEKNSSWT